MDDEDRYLKALGIDGWPHEAGRVRVRGQDPVYPAKLPIGEAAAVALALGGAAAAELHTLRGAEPADVEVEVGHAAATLLGFVFQARQEESPESDLMRNAPATVAMYPTRDGRWIHLHGGFPGLHEGTLKLLGCSGDTDSIAAAVMGWNALELEDALAQAGMCGAMVRSPEEWDAHPQSAALRTLPVVSIERIGDAPVMPLAPAARPLSGIRVLDLTRVLAGPSSGRTLAQYGADVLRVGARKLPTIEPFVMDTGHGKRSTFLDLDVPGDFSRIENLIRESDVFVDGFRGGSLAARGLSSESLAALRPGIVHVSIRCYGDRGPFAERRGWEQLAQSATGVAWIEGGAETPRLLPAAATDYTTGYLAAYGALEALHRRATEGGSYRVEVSLCRTAMWLRDLGADKDPAAAAGLPDIAAIQTLSHTAQGDLLHLSPAVSLSSSKVEWKRPTGPMGLDAPEWLE